MNLQIHTNKDFLNLPTNLGFDMNQKKIKQNENT